MRAAFVVCVTVYTTTSWTLRLLRLLSQVTCFTWWAVLVPERAAGLSQLRTAAVQCHITNWKGQSCYSSVNYESYRNIKCCHTVYVILVFLCALLEFVLVCPHFSVDFHSACFFFLFTPSHFCFSFPSLPSLPPCNHLLFISIQLVLGAAYSCPVTSHHASPLTQALPAPLWTYFHISLCLSFCFFCATGAEWGPCLLSDLCQLKMIHVR